MFTDRGIRMKKSKREKMQAAVYDRLRIHLEKEQQDLQHRIDRTESQLLSRAVANSESRDEASSEQEDLIERSLLYRRKLKLVIQTLRRFHEGSFGLCALCEEPIGQKRLEALPTAKHCIRCQREQEQCQVGYQVQLRFSVS